jgi:type II secretory pathway pseudopilin PulG
MTASSPSRATSRREAGFTLTELAVVFAIVVLLLGSATYTVTAQIESRALADAQRRLGEARDLLVAFAQANGRLPCPGRYADDTDHSAGLEAWCVASTGTCNADPPAANTRTTTVQSHGNCADFYDGYLPAASIGYTPIDSAGFALDPWGYRIRYAVAQKTAHPTGTTTCKKLDGTLLTGQKYLFTKIRAADETLIGCVPDEMVVCASASGITGTSCGTASVMTNQNVVVAVVLSTGKNYGTAQSSARASALGRADEAANLDGDGVFIWHAPRATTEANEFDDQVTWLPSSVLYQKMIAAGVLP